MRSWLVLLACTVPVTPSGPERPASDSAPTSDSATDTAVDTATDTATDSAGDTARTDTSAPVDTSAPTDTADTAAVDTGRPYVGARVTDVLAADGVFRGDYDNAWLGRHLAVGDLDGDGLDDLAMITQGNGGDPYNGGRVYLVGAPPSGTVLTDTLAVYYDGTIESAGTASMLVEDLDGDGQDDLVVGVNPSGGRADYGAYVLRGPLTGTGNLRGDLALVTDDADTQFGWRLSAGDLDGDGVPDLASTGRADDAGVAGRAFVFAGPIDADATPADALARYDSSAVVGDLEASADFDGDGFADLAIGEPGYDTNRGRVLVFAGPVDPLLLLGDAASVLEAPSEWLYAGAALAGGDLDGDGYGELITGASQGSSYNPGPGYAWVVRGPLPGTGDLDVAATTIVRGDRDTDYTGAQVAVVDDLDADGASEWVVGVLGEDFAFGDEGVACLFSGLPWGVIHPLDMAEVCFAGSDNRDFVGDDLVLADLSGDGVLDVFVGDSEASPRVHHYRGEVHYYDGATLGEW